MIKAFAVLWAVGTTLLVGALLEHNLHPKYCQAAHGEASSLVKRQEPGSTPGPGSSPSPTPSPDPIWLLTEPSPTDTLTITVPKPRPGHSIQCQEVWDNRYHESTFDDTVDKWISEKAKEQVVDSFLLQAIMIVESRGDHSARSARGAVGLFQLMPRTARVLGINPHDPEENVEGGAKYLSYLLRKYKGDVTLTLAAWNAGEGRVAEWGGVPPFTETINFIAKVKVAREVLAD